ncbi:MAG TPA: hypothetical protein VKE41_02985 [Roseiflexaceae bacterium]|nr:hypothetical protein [Roseiflexaceae bacterium]
MTERQGAFTISTRLLLSSEQRARLERLVLDQRIDLADLVSMVVADHCAALPRVVSARPSGAATVPVRLFLTPSARQQIEQAIQEQGVDLADLVSQIVATYLDTLPAAPPAPEPARDSSVDLRQRRAELGRLRARRDVAGSAAPAWLVSYIAELEAEIHKLEG